MSKSKPKTESGTKAESKAKSKSKSKAETDVAPSVAPPLSVPRAGRVALSGIVLVARLVIFLVIAWVLLCFLFLVVSWLSLGLGSVMGATMDSGALSLLVCVGLPGVFLAVSAAWIWVSVVRFCGERLVVRGWRAFVDGIRNA